jgi:hypothetical protein
MWWWHRQQTKAEEKDKDGESRTDGDIALRRFFHIMCFNPKTETNPNPETSGNEHLSGNEHSLPFTPGIIKNENPNTNVSYIVLYK